METRLMAVTGYALRTAIKAWEVRRDAAFVQFAPSLKKFDGEDKMSPQDISDRYLECEAAIAGLQVAQAQYNLSVSVSLPGFNSEGTVPLAFAIKIIGGVGRIGKAWRDAATATNDRGRYGYDEDERDPNKVRAHPTVSRKEAGDAAEAVDRKASRIRQAIAEANSVRFEVAADPKWFD